MPAVFTSLQHHPCEDRDHLFEFVKTLRFGFEPWRNALTALFL